MTVGQLQKYLRGLADAIGAHGKTPAKDLIDVADRLDPFAALGMAAFGDFLLLADEYKRTGILSEAGKSTAKRTGEKRPPAPKATPATPAEITALLNEWQSRVLTDPSLTRDKVQAELRGMKGRLNKDGWFAVAGAMGYLKKPASIDAAIGLLVEHVMARKGAFERSDA